MVTRWERRKGEVDGERSIEEKKISGRDIIEVKPGSTSDEEGRFGGIDDSTHRPCLTYRSNS